MKRIAFAFLLLAASSLSAAPGITGILPPQVYSFASTPVTIYGRELVDAEIDCRCSDFNSCPVKVFAGSLQGYVTFATPHRIEATLPALPAGVMHELRVEAPGRSGLRLLITSDLAVEHRPSNTRYLLPLRPARADGALGSEWETRLAVRNGSQHPLVLLPEVNGQRVVIPPFTTEDEHVRTRFPAGDGVFVYVPNPLAAATEMTLHVRDTSRIAEGLGTEVPVVPERDFRQTVNLLGVPTDARYRATLRMYGNSYYPVSVTVRFYREGEAAPFAEQPVLLNGFISIAPIELPDSPAYAQLDPLTQAVRAAAPRVRIEVATGSTEKVWALLSITNNETQQVTLMTPHR